MLHLVGYLFNMNYDERNHELKKVLKSYLTSLLFQVSYISLAHLHLLYSYFYNVF